MEEKIFTLPTVALRGMTILPGIVAHFDISRKKSLHAVQAAMTSNQKLFLITQKNENQEEPDREGLYEIGTVVEVKQVIKLQNDIIRILVEGSSRAQMYECTQREDFIEAKIQILEETIDEEKITEIEHEAMLQTAVDALEKYAAMSGRVSKETLRQAKAFTKLIPLIDFIAENAFVRYKQKQKILEELDIEERFQMLMVMLFQEMEIIGIKSEFHQKVKHKVDKRQKEYLLREQMSVLREELGEDSSQSTIEEYQEALRKLKAPKEVKDCIKKEIDRLKTMNSNSSESTVSCSYIETLLEIPWEKKQKENHDLARAEEILNRDHYGLEKVKERMLEFLAVRNLTKKGESPIVCLVGPPGTGKTSIARSVAEALNKKYVRISLGGVRDEAEIRGHRRTYVGAMPGRIVNGLKDAGVCNPLMLLDEIDKVSSDYKGDTSAALLEVLDSEQNCKFRDHYVGLPVNLSEVMFIATANNASSIPKPLLDRMEIIEVSSYTENEKQHIAMEHLFEKQLEKHGISKEQLSIGSSAMAKMIRGYTKEAGVRDLERKIGAICRKAAKEIYEDSNKKVKVTCVNLEKYLGKERYRTETKNEKDEVGIVRGLAWTPVGGVTLEIEVNIMPGKGNLLLTGKLGDVMKESGQAGISYIRSVSKKYKIDAEFFQNNDIHVHIPEGAVPKDGPSAGITMATAIFSAITGKPVRSDVAMTGEITLRGRVLPIGGLKEKLLAAKNAGIKTVCIPKENERDLSEISMEIRRGMEIIPVEHMDEVLKISISTTKKRG